MSVLSGLKPEISVPVAVGTAGLVFGIYQLALPNLTDVKASAPNNPVLQGSENAALWLSVAVSAGISLIAGDVTPFVLGGMMAVSLSWIHRHAAALDPTTMTLIGKDGSSMHASPASAAAVAPNLISMSNNDSYYAA